MDQRVSLITLGVADLGRARDFYRAMGWQPGGRASSSILTVILGKWRITRDGLSIPMARSASTADGRPEPSRLTGPAAGAFAADRRPEPPPSRP
jgi:hypothetical protein